MAINALEQTSKYRKEAKRWKNKALEQKQVIDKIREEINQDSVIDVSGSKFVLTSRVNQIIDKYKAEREK